MLLGCNKKDDADDILSIRPYEKKKKFGWSIFSEGLERVCLAGDLQRLSNTRMLPNLISHRQQQHLFCLDYLIASDY